MSVRGPSRIGRLRELYWEWQDARPAPAQRLPTALQFPVNDICNSRCQMCHIWERKRDHEITPAELATILDNPLFREVREVGLNGGEPTLRRDLSELAHVMASRLPRLRGFTLITNAIRERQVRHAIEELEQVSTTEGVALNVMISLDGIGAVHDRVRGVKGNYESAERVLLALKESTVATPLIGCTLIRENVFDAERVLAFAKAHNIYARFRVGIPHRRLYTDRLTEPFAFDADERYHLACFLDELRLNYEKSPVRQDFYLSLRNQIINGAPRTAGCAWKNRGITLTSRAELAYCAVESPILGSLLEERADHLYWGQSAILQRIVETRCQNCLHDYNALQDRTVFWTRVLRTGVPRLPGGKTVFRIAQRTRHVLREREADRKARLASPVSVKEGSNDILLCGWYGTETLGDKAILAGLLTALRHTGWAGNVDLASLEPYVSKQTLREMPELALRRIESVVRAREAVARGAYRAVCVAGGPLMSPVAEIYDLLGLFTEAAAAGTRRGILGCGIGPLGPSRKRDEAIAQLLTLSNTTILRDAASLDQARNRLHFTGNAMVSHDPAFIWCQQRLTDAGDAGARNGPILLALRDWQVQEYGKQLPAKTANEIKRHFESELVVMVDELHRLAPHWGLKPVAMHTHACGGDDRMFFQRLLADHPSLLANISWRRESPACLFKEFRNARAVVAMRFHSLVLSVATGTPHVAIDYTRGGKIAGLISRIPGESPAFAIDDFSGKACAESVIAATQSPIPPAPVGIGAAYTVAWKQLLASAP